MTRIEPIRWKYPDVVDDIAEMYDSFADATVEGEEMSNDAGLQVISDAKRICEEHDVPQEDRIDVICGGLRKVLVERVDEHVEQCRWQLSVLSGL